MSFVGNFEYFPCLFYTPSVVTFPVIFFFFFFFAFVPQLIQGLKEEINSYLLHNTVAKCMIGLPVCAALTFKINFPGSLLFALSKVGLVKT